MLLPKEKLNRDAANTKILIPIKGWSVADRKDGPLYAQKISRAFSERLQALLDPRIEMREVNYHINDEAFAGIATDMIAKMIGHE